MSGWLGGTYEHFDVTGSTNTYLKENTHRLPHGHVVTADLQTAGKGRLGRNWLAPSGSCLALSFLLKDWPEEELSALPLLIGLAVSRAAERYAGIETAVKWSNDVLAGNRKLCGILCESIIADSRCSIVCGLGINMLQTRRELDGLSLVYATSLFLETGKKPDTDVLRQTVLAELEPLLDGFRESGFTPYLPDYKSRCVTLGKQVLLCTQGVKTLEAYAEDVAGTGELICRAGGQVVRVNAGEVSVRGIYGYV